MEISEQQLSDLVQKVTVQTLIQFGLLPDPKTGMFAHPPHQTELLQMLNGGNSLDAKLVELTMLPSTQVMDITERFNSTTKHGWLMVELDILINTLIKIKDRLRSEPGPNEVGVLGLDVVDN